MDFFLQLLFAGISRGAVYALIAHGFNVTYWTLRVVNFAHGSFLMIAVMLSLAAHKAGVPLVVALVVGISSTAVLVGVLERVSVRPVLRFPGGMGWIVSTLGAGIVLQALATLLWGAQATAFPPVVFDSTDYVRVLGVQLSAQLLLVLVAALAVMIALEVVMRRTLWGKVFRATAFDPDCARLRGIPVRRVVTASFVLSGALAGLAGVLIAPVTGIDPAFGIDLMLKGFVAAVVGGMGSSIGALAGGAVVGVIELLVGGYVSSSARNAVAFLLLIVILVVRPTGLFGKRAVVKV